MFHATSGRATPATSNYSDWMHSHYGEAECQPAPADLHAVGSPDRSGPRANGAADGGASSGISELVLSRDCPGQLTLLLPMLAHLSRQAGNRWVTWIAPAGVGRRTLEHYGVDTGKIRLVYPHKQDDILWITWEALVTGNSHTVISTPGKLNNRNFSLLQKAAVQGRAQGLLLRIR